MDACSHRPGCVACGSSATAARDRGAQVLVRTVNETYDEQLRAVRCPVELVWGNVKGSELANLCADNLDEVEHELRTGLRRVGRSPTLAFAFLRHTGLSF